MDKHLQNSHTRYELRQLIIPLLQRCLNENPSDLIQFCSGYFQSLLDGGKNTELSEEHIPLDDGRKKERRRVSVEKKPLLQGSTSLPTLNEDASEEALQLRETSSWNNGSSIRQIPAQRKNVHFNVADAESMIGDQLNVEEVDTGIADKVLNSKVSTCSNYSEGTKGLIKKVEHNDVVYEKSLDSYCNNVCTLSTSSSTEEVEEEFKTLVNLAEHLSCSQPASSTRKKWNINNDMQQGRKLVISETDDADPCNALDLCNLEEEINKEFAALNMESTDDRSPDSSFGFIPKIKDLEKLVVPMENIRYSMSTEDIETLVKSVSRTLQELIHVLCASRLYFNEKLEKVKDIRVSEPKSQSVELRQIPPRKKRSITTFSDFDSRPRNEKNSHVPFTEKIDKDEVNRMNDVKEVSNDVTNESNGTKKLDENRMETKHTHKFPEHNEVNAASDFADADSRNEELNAKGSAVIDPFQKQTKKKNETASETKTSIDEYENKQKPAEGDKNKSCKNKSHFYKEHSVSQFESSYGNVNQRASKKRRNANNYYQDGRFFPSFDPRQGYNNRSPRFSSESPVIRMPQGTSSRSQGYNNRPPRHMPPYYRGSHHPTRPRTESSNVLEGGDVMHSNLLQRTIGTETDFSPVNEQPKNSNAKISVSDSHTKTTNSESNTKIKLTSKSSTSDRMNEVSGKNDSNRAKVQEKNCTGKEITKIDSFTKTSKYESNAKLKLTSSSSERGNDASRKEDSNCPKVQEKNCSVKDNTKIVNPARTDIVHESAKNDQKNPKAPGNVFKPEPDSYMKNISENPSDLSQEKETKQGKCVASLSRPISNSSLNPSAKCFNPLYMRVKESSESAANSADQKKLTKSESDCCRHPGVFTHSKDSELSGKKYRIIDWTIESCVNDKEHGNANNASVSNMEDGNSSNLRKNDNRQYFTPTTRNVNQRVSDQNLDPNRLPMENGGRGSANGNIPNQIKRPDIKNSFKRSSSSDWKMAEGDHCNEDLGHGNSPPKQEEPGLSSACGDFVATEEENNSQPNEERQEDIPENQPTADEQEINLSSMNIQDRSILSPILENVDRNGRRIEETELNFACLSDTDTSELDSDLSEDYFYEERSVPEHDNC